MWVAIFWGWFSVQFDGQLWHLTHRGFEQCLDGRRGRQQTCTFFIEHPADHEKQKEIASAFYNASSAGFDSCAGAIDGILIWTQKPSEKDAAKCGLGQKKFLCGRKNKFGLNCQAALLIFSLHFSGVATVMFFTKEW
jgi:hypothetical protein